MKYQIISNALLIREKPDPTSKIVGLIQGKPTVSVSSVKNGFGKIESGWINLEFAEKIEEEKKNEKPHK